jgi:hypothetical protein
MPMRLSETFLKTLEKLIIARKKKSLVLLRLGPYAYVTVACHSKSCPLTMSLIVP